MSLYFAGCVKFFLLTCVSFYTFVQSYVGGVRQEREKVLWARFETSDCNGEFANFQGMGVKGSR